VLLCPPQSQTDRPEDEKKRKNCEDEEEDVTTSQNAPSVFSTKTYGIMMFIVILLVDPKSCKTQTRSVSRMQFFSVKACNTFTTLQGLQLPTVEELLS
jgi:hypothetical protein